jgi:hypothetical protein
VLGAGVSRAAELPDGEQLAEWLPQHVPMTEPPHDGTSLFSVVDAVDPEKTSASDLQRLVAAHIESFPPQPTPFINELVHLPSRFIITLNYDDLVGLTAERQGLEVRRLSTLNPQELIEAHRRLTDKAGEPPPELTVLHLHGQARTPETVVLDSASYQRLMRLPEIKEIVFSLAHFRALAFVGTKLDESYLLTQLQEQINPAPHVVFCHEGEVTALTTGRAALSMRQHLRVVGYPDHPDLIVLPHWLVAPQPARDAKTAASALDPATTPDPASYISSEFREELTRAAVAESDILTGQRTVVVGVAGTGKTHLLSWLAAQTDAGRPAVRIRLADVPMGPGRPEAILKAWAMRAHADPGQPTIDIGPVALQEDRLHFLLDGLDEVTNELQDTAARLIVQVAERFPQHAFTVTSRPITALASLGRGQSDATTAWHFVDLAPGAAWQKRYLADRGLTLDNLHEVMPALRDMRELLHIPFFLTRTVELFESGQLEGLRDVGQLLERLVDSALSREEELLPLVAIDDARAWLRRVALAAAIAGRRTFTVAELQAVPVDGETVGDPAKLVQQLQLRLLLAEDDGQVRFTHRLLADELVAETLAPIDPSDALLDALVPVVDRQLMGVRDDVVIAVSLLCLRSPAWREAVARRDPLAAARSTPSDAASAEREHSVELLWHAYRDWGIWAWDRSAPDLLEDTEVIARLVRLASDGSQVEMLRERLQRGNEIEQGNAVRILARVKPAGLDEDLRKVLRDSARNGVVIRQAAIAAADLELTDLVDDIVDAMLKASDSLIQQDGSIALEMLTPDARLLNVAKQLIPARGTDLFASVARKRMSPSDRIELARALGVAGVDVLSDDRHDLAAAASEVTPSNTVVRAAACAAALWGDESEAVEALLRSDSKAAACGLLEAHEHGAEWWDVGRLARLADLSILRDSTIDERVVQTAEQALEFEALSQAEKDELRRATEQSWATAREAARADHDRPPALAELLRRPADASDKAIQAEAFRLRGQVKTLETEDLSELCARLVRWWPTDPLRDLVVEDGDQFTLAPPAAAWLFLAPAVDMPVSDEQWAQLAASPWVTQEQSTWLRSQANVANMKLAVGHVMDRRPKAWLRFLDCCPVPPPQFVLAACARVVASDPNEPEHTTQLIRRLNDQGNVSTARQWAERDAAAAQALRPTLAAEGDLDAQRSLLDELLADVRGGLAHPRDELAWMSNLRAPQFLGTLFEILDLTYPSSVDAPKSGWNVRDALTPTLEAITRIGTRDAVTRYDALLARGDDRRWLREQRDQIAASVLRAKGDHEAPGAAAISHLPHFGS